MPTRSQGSDTSPEAALPTDVLLGAYAAVTARRTSFDTMMWQVPALAMTAQAFLLTIALGNGSARISREIAAVLAMFLSIMSMQLMAKHRFLENVDNQLSERLEHSLGVAGGAGTVPHGTIPVRAGGLALRLPWWIRLSSYRLWLGGLALFAVADGMTGVLAAVHPTLFR